MACSSRFPGSAMPASRRCPCLCGSPHAPHLIERVHVERKVVQLAPVVRDRAVRVAVERHKRIHEIPDSLVRGVENMRSICMDMDSLDIIAIDVPAEMWALVDNKSLFSLLFCKRCECRAVQAGADNKVIVFHFLSRSFIKDKQNWFRSKSKART